MYGIPEPELEEDLKSMMVGLQVKDWLSKCKFIKKIIYWSLLVRMPDSVPLLTTESSLS